MSDDERVWLNIRSLIDSIENGGLISYFYNSGADNLVDCRGALDRLGAAEVRKLVEQVCYLFGNVVPETLEERNRIIDSWDDNPDRDELTEEIDDQLMPMMPELESALLSFLRDAGLAR